MVSSVLLMAYSSSQKIPIETKGVDLGKKKKANGSMNHTLMIYVD